MARFQNPFGHIVSPTRASNSNRGVYFPVRNDEGRIAGPMMFRPNSLAGPPDNAAAFALPVPPMTAPYAPAPTRAQRNEGVRQRRQAAFETSMGSARRAADDRKMVAGTFGALRAGGMDETQARQKAHAAGNLMAGGLPGMAAIPTNGLPQPQQGQLSIVDQAKAYQSLTDGQMDPEEAKSRVFGPPTGQAQASPLASLGQVTNGYQAAAPRPTNQIQLTEQQAQRMYDVLRESNPTLGGDQLAKQFASTVGRYGVTPEQAGQLVGRFSGTPGGSEVARPDLAGPPTVAPAQARMDVQGPGRGGIVTRPNGERVSLDEQGGVVGLPLSRGPALPPVTTPAPIPMGPRQGYTPLDGGYFAGLGQAQPAPAIPTVTATASNVSAGATPTIGLQTPVPVLAPPATQPQQGGLGAMIRQTPLGLIPFGDIAGAINQRVHAPFQPGAALNVPATQPAAAPRVPTPNPPGEEERRDAWMRMVQSDRFLGGY